MNRFRFANTSLPTAAVHAPSAMRGGFTLVELVVVIAIIGILATVAVPSFMQTITSMRAKAATSDLYAALMKTRSEAIKRNAKVTLSITDDAKGWQIYPSSSPGSVLENHTISGEVSLTGGTIEYNSSGRAAGEAAFTITATIGSNTSSGCVSISLSGLPNAKAAAC